MIKNLRLTKKMQNCKSKFKIGIFFFWFSTFNFTHARGRLACV